MIGQSHYLSISKVGFIYRGVTLMNMLDESLRSEQKLIRKFKAGLKKWVKANKAVKLKPRFSVLGRVGRKPSTKSQPII